MPVPVPSPAPADPNSAAELVRRAFPRRPGGLFSPVPGAPETGCHTLQGEAAGGDTATDVKAAIARRLRLLKASS